MWNRPQLDFARDQNYTTDSLFAWPQNEQTKQWEAPVFQRLPESGCSSLPNVTPVFQRRQSARYDPRQTCLSKNFLSENSIVNTQRQLQCPQPQLCMVSPLTAEHDQFRNFVAVSPRFKKRRREKELRRQDNVNYAVKTVSLAELPYTGRQIARAVYPTIVEKKYTVPVLDPRNPSLHVYEYPIGAHLVIWNHSTGMVHLTGLWRAAIQEGIYGFEEPAFHLSRPYDSQQQRVMRILIKPNAKADIAKLLDSTPRSLHACIKRVRGGFLKIQGTWITYALCKVLAARFAYYIRYHLVPIFGADFPRMCVPPLSPSFGELKFDEDVLRAMHLAKRPLLLCVSPRLQNCPNQKVSDGRPPRHVQLPRLVDIHPRNSVCSLPRIVLNNTLPEPHKECATTLPNTPEVMKIASLLT